MPFDSITGSVIGRVGGLANYRKNGREHMKALAAKGGAKTKEKGFDFFSMIGKMPQKGRFIDINTLIADYNDGMSTRSLASKHGWNIQNLRKYLHQAE